jgi:hypothetical protein
MSNSSVTPSIEFKIEQSDVKMDFVKRIISSSSNSNDLNFLDMVVVGNFIIGINQNKTLSMYKVKFQRRKYFCSN